MVDKLQHVRDWLFYGCSISRESSTTSQRPSSAGSGKAVTPAETAATARMQKLEKGWVEPEISASVMSSDGAEDKKGTEDSQGRFRVRSSAEVFYRGLGGEAADKLPRTLPAINCRAGDFAATDAGHPCTVKEAKGRKTGCAGCSVM